MAAVLATIIACAADPATTLPTPTPLTSDTDTAPPPFVVTIPEPSCEASNQQCYSDDGTYYRSSDGCACVSDELLCGDDCVRYDPETWNHGGAITTCSDGGTLVAGPNAEATYYALRFDASGALMGLRGGGYCGSMVICTCCDGVVLDTVVEGNFAPCN